MLAAYCLAWFTATDHEMSRYQSVSSWAADALRPSGLARELPGESGAARALLQLGATNTSFLGARLWR
jgi:hypothetical protein